MPIAEHDDTSHMALGKEAQKGCSTAGLSQQEEPRGISATQ